MNFGSCPYPNCTGDFFFSVPERTPAYAQVTCDCCERPVWYRFSRVNPQAWTEEGFLSLYEVDAETQCIKRRDEAQPDDMDAESQMPMLPVQDAASLQPHERQFMADFLNLLLTPSDQMATDPAASALASQIIDSVYVPDEKRHLQS